MALWYDILLSTILYDGNAILLLIICNCLCKITLKDKRNSSKEDSADDQDDSLKFTVSPVREEKVYGDYVSTDILDG